MRILHFSMYFFPHVGGGTMTAYGFARGFVQLGHQVTLVTPKVRFDYMASQGKPSPSMENYEGIMVRRVPVFFGHNLRLACRTCYPNLKSAGNKIASVEKPAAVFANFGPFHFAAMSAVAVGKENKLPVVVRVDDLFLEPPSGTMWKRVYKKFEGYLNSRTLRNADYVVTVTEGLKRIAIEHHKVSPEKIDVVPNGVHLDRFTSANGSTVREKLGLAPETKVVIFVGALYKHRGIEVLIRALPLLHKEIRDLKIIIAGDGPDLEYLRALAGELDVSQDVIFAGFVSSDDVPHYLAVADVAIGPLIKHPRTAHSAPIKVFEYMAAGKPVIARKDTISDKILIDGYNGLQTVSDEPQETAEKIEELLTDNAKARRLGQNGQQFVRQNYDWKILAKKIIEIYSKLS